MSIPPSSSSNSSLMTSVVLEGPSSPPEEKPEDLGFTSISSDVPKADYPPSHYAREAALNVSETIAGLLYRGLVVPIKNGVGNIPVYPGSHRTKPPEKK